MRRVDDAAVEPESYGQPLLLLGRSNFAQGDALHFDPSNAKPTELRPVYSSDEMSEWTYPPPLPGTGAPEVPADLKMLILRFERGIELRIVLRMPDELGPDYSANAFKARSLAQERSPGLAYLVSACSGGSVYPATSIFG